MSGKSCKGCWFIYYVTTAFIRNLQH